MSPATKAPERRAPETGLITKVEAEKIVAKYAKEKNVDLVTAECMLIATAWRRLEALRRYSDDMKRIADEKEAKAAAKVAPKAAPTKAAAAPQKAPKVAPAPTAPKTTAKAKKSTKPTKKTSK